jgi:hypothetical protein
MSTIDKYTNLKDKLTLVHESRSYTLLYDDKPIRIQTPGMYIPFGCRQYQGKFDKVTCTLDLSLRGYEEEHSKSQRFLEWYAVFEEQLIEKMGLPQDDLNSSLKNDNPNYPPFLRVKAPIEDGLLKSSVWLEHDEEPQVIYGNLDNKFKGNTALSIISPTVYKLPHGKWGVSWKLEQIRLFEPRRLKGFLFLD